MKVIGCNDLKMESRVYYGEYTLKHWVKLILKRNIILPEYQRSFVWNENDIIRLMKSLYDGQFVQPVTIANYKTNNKEVNLLLDGQQRLTSILLTLIGYFPDKDKFDSVEELASSDDSDDEEIVANKVIKWTFESLLEEDPTKNDIEFIKERINKQGVYNQLKLPFINNIDDFFENTFLGFSYIIPSADNQSEIQKYFSNLFRNMNFYGVKLSSLESRRSLYYLNDSLKNYFDGLTINENDVLCDIQMIEQMKLSKIDFVRYISILSEYIANDNNVSKVLVGYSAYSSRENYYADYVSYILGLEQENRNKKFDKFDFNSLFPNNSWMHIYEYIRNTLEGIKYSMDLKKNAFTSWIDADYWLFGLIYFILFKKKTIRYNDNLISEIKEEIRIKRNDEYYKKNTNRLNNLRDRIQSSIDIYSKYAE